MPDVFHLDAFRQTHRREKDALQHMKLIYIEIHVQCSKETLHPKTKIEPHP